MHAPGPARTAIALTWPVHIHNGSLLCGREDGSGTPCWTMLIEAPPDPEDLPAFTPALVTAAVIRHFRACSGYT